MTALLRAFCGLAFVLLAATQVVRAEHGELINTRTGADGSIPAQLDVPATVPDVASYVDTLAAIDTHAHPMAYVATGAPADTDFDALPLDGIPPFDLPLPLHADNPEYLAAQTALYGSNAGERDSIKAAAFTASRESTIQQHGAKFPRRSSD